MSPRDALPDVRDLMPGERILWQGRPDWRSLARDVLLLRWVALYLAGSMIWNAYLDRSAGLGPGETLLAGVPWLVLGAGLLGGCAAFAWSYARATRYTITSERCILQFGLALTATLSVPLRQVAAVAASVRPDGTGDIPLALKPGRPVPFLKLFPYARPWRFGRPEPMLRGVRDVAEVAQRLSTAVALVAPGRLAAMPLPAPRPAMAAEGG